jgi:hypothetical protein
VSTKSHLISLRGILILSCLLCLYLSSEVLQLRFCTHFSSPLCMLHLTLLNLITPIIFVENSSLNVFDDGAVVLLFKFWTFSTVSLFLNHNVSRDGSSLVLR